MTATTHIAKRKQKAQALKQGIEQLLGWSQFEYGNFQYECGLAYLRHYITHDQWGQDMLQRSRLFWNWWKNQWAFRDEAFLAEHAEGLNKVRMETRITMYKYVHDAAMLASEIYPNRTVLDESYCMMIDELHKEILHD